MNDQKKKMNEKIKKMNNTYVEKNQKVSTCCQHCKKQKFWRSQRKIINLLIYYLDIVFLVHLKVHFLNCVPAVLCRRIDTTIF